MSDPPGPIWGPFFGPSFARKPVRFRFRLWVLFWMSSGVHFRVRPGPQKSPETVKNRSQKWNRYRDLRVSASGGPEPLCTVKSKYEINIFQSGCERKTSLERPRNKSEMESGIDKNVCQTLRKTNPEQIRFLDFIRTLKRRLESSKRIPKMDPILNTFLTPKWAGPRAVPLRAPGMPVPSGDFG